MPGAAGMQPIPRRSQEGRGRLPKQPSPTTQIRDRTNVLGVIREAEAAEVEAAVEATTAPRAEEEDEDAAAEEVAADPAEAPEAAEEKRTKLV